MKKVVFYICVFLILGFCRLNGQTMEHPVIWITADEREHVLELIDTYPWAQSIVSKLRSTVDAKVNSHVNNPASILNTIPAIPADDNLSESEAINTGNHTKILLYASYAGMLYYITEEEKYAQFSADILSYYIDVLATRTPQTTTISGNYFYDPRTSYAHFAIAYDLVHCFLTTPETQVYRKSTGTRVDFDNSIAQTAIRNMAVNALQEFSGDDTHGKIISNHPVLRSPGVLFSILCVEDDVERERLFSVFWEKGTNKQNSFKNTILPMFGTQGIWPESTSYSFMPNITMILNVIDRIKPEMNVIEGNMSILDGNFLFDNLRLPDRRFVRYGDSKRNTDGTEALYQNTLYMARRRGFLDYEHKAIVALKQTYEATGAYNPSVSTSTFDNYDAYRNLFWGVPIPETVEDEIDFQKPTVIIEHAGIALQRNSVKNSNRSYGLTGIIGGAHYVHSHVTGISMELYGSGYVMGPGGGLPPSLAERNYPEHREYFMRHAGNNTVIVNGTSHGRQEGSWSSNSYVWQNTAVNVASEPKHLEDPINKNFSFATQYLADQVNNCQQERTLSIVRTSETSAYYFDMFRSKSLATNNFHDYVYHNLGDDMHLFDINNQELDVAATTMYQNDIGDLRKSPGWIHFENTNVSETTDEAVKVRFDLNESGVFMHMFAPAGVDRQYTKALGPSTREAKGSYINKKTQIVAIRQQGEAWEKPYVSVFEPTQSVFSSVKSVTHLYNGDAIIGARVMSEVGDKTIEDFILCLPAANSSATLPKYGISFTGRFAVVRYEQDLEKAYTTLYIGEGDSLSYGDFKLIPDASRKGVRVKEGEPYFGRQLIFKNIKDKDVIPKGSSLSIEAIVGEEYTEVSLWVNDTIDIGTKTTAPYLWSDHPILNNMQADEYRFTLIAKDANGGTERESILVETPGQKPYPDRDTPHSIPGKIEFEDYDFGGENLGYFDNSEQNLSLYTYRDSDYVDLDRNGTIISSLEAGEWLEYTVNVEQAGMYMLSVRHRTIAVPSVNGFSVLGPTVEDTLLSNCQTLYTGRSAFYEDEIGELFLNPGKQVLRFSILDAGFDLDYMELKWMSTSRIKDVTAGAQGFTVFPNPANDCVYIDIKYPAGRLHIYDLNGKLKKELLINYGANKVSIAEFPDGVLLLNLSVNDTTFRHKIVKHTTF